MVPTFLKSIPPRRLRLLLYLAGLVVLLAGYTGAALIFRAQDRLDQKNANRAANESDPLSTLDSRSGTRQVELYYGKSGIVMEETLDWFQNLTHGRPLAKTIIVLSSAGAIGCFVVAARQG